MPKTAPRKGFTLIEIMVVVGIIGLLTAVVAISLSRQRSTSRNARRTADLKNTQTVLDLYANENGDKYPTSTISNNAYSGDPSAFRANRPGGADGALGAYIPSLVPTYMRSLPVDPLYNPATEQYKGYLYWSNGTDYAFLAHGSPEGTWDSSHQFYDPVRYVGYGGSYPSWKVYSAGGVNR